MSCYLCTALIRRSCNYHIYECLRNMMEYDTIYNNTVPAFRQQLHPGTNDGS